MPGGSNDLSKHCDKEKIPYLPFLDFSQVKEHVKKLVDGDISLEELGSGKVEPQKEVREVLGK